MNMKRFLLAAILVLQALDVLTTNHVLALGGHEGNPIVQAGQAYLGAFWWLPKLAMAVVLIPVMDRWPVRKVVPIACLLSAVVINNLVQGDLVMNNNNTVGYAVKVNGQINVRSVGPHPRSAMVNWLITDCQVALSNAMSDGDIKAIFDHYAGRIHARCVPISILEVVEAMA